MISVQHLTKKYGSITAVNDISFEVEKGEIVGFLGPNGAGKSTTMKILTGFLPPTSGHANIAGFDVFTKSIEARKRIGRGCVGSGTNWALGTLRWRSPSRRAHGCGAAIRCGSWPYS